MKIDSIKMFDLDWMIQTFGEFKSICVVGNGPLSSRDVTQLSSKLHSSDIVVRFNDWNRRRSFDINKYGTRCDLNFNHLDSCPIITGKFQKPKSVVIAIPAPFHYDSIPKKIESFGSEIDSISMVNPYINYLMCQDLKLESNGCGHPIGTVGFTFLYHMFRILSISNYDCNVFVTGFSWRFDNQTKKFDQSCINNFQHIKCQNHSYVSEFCWVYDNLRNDHRFEFSNTAADIFNTFQNREKFNEDFYNPHLVQKLIRSSKPFALPRFGEGELCIMNGIDQVRKRGGWEFDHNLDTDQAFRKELIESYNYYDDSYYVGTDPDKQLFGEAGAKTYVNACIFVNSNYSKFLSSLFSINVPMAIVCSEDADLTKVSLPIQQIFRVSEYSCWRTNQDIEDELCTFLSDKHGWLILFACGPFSCVLIHKLWISNKNNYLLDIGSTLDPIMFGTYTRLYQKSHSSNIQSLIPQPSKSEECTIPNLIHFVWVGSNPLPNWARYCINKFKSLNPDYSIQIHGEDSLDPNFLPLLEKFPDIQLCSLADLIRISVLKKFGGWYFDVDCLPISTIDEIKIDLNISDTFWCRQRDKRVNNAVLGLSKDNPIWDLLYAYCMTTDVYKRTVFGPDLFTKIPELPQLAYDVPFLFYPVNLKSSAINIFKSVLNGTKIEIDKHFQGIRKLHNHDPHLIHLWMNTIEDVNFLPDDIILRVE